MTKNILVVDDDERLRMLLQSYLRQEGFEVTTAINGREALFAARQVPPDLIILDLMMPEMDGFEFMKARNKEWNTPVIVLTAKVNEQDKVLGLELGADDYVSKPFSLRELTARVRAVLRRTGQVAPVPEQLCAAGIILDRGTRMVQVDDQQST